MEPLTFVMAILGCGEVDAPCREVRLAETRYQTEAQCIAATGAELIRHDDLPYPTVVAQCRAAGAAPQPLRGSEVMLPDGGELRFERPRVAEAAPRRQAPKLGGE
jgi:hypothetical protein